MCGIWFYCAPTGTYDKEYILSCAHSDNLKARGPDRSIVKKITVRNFDFFLVFHRLAIMDLSEIGDQPFHIKNNKEEIYLMCNGEIYGYKHLIEKYQLQNKIISNSDCEVLIHLYNKLGLEGLYEELSDHYEVSGEFAMVILHVKDNNVLIHCARDVGGVRPLYYSHNYSHHSAQTKINGLCLSSQLCGIPVTNHHQMVQQVKAYSIHTYTIPFDDDHIQEKLHKIYDLRDIPITIYDETEAVHKIQKVLTKCVEDRFASDRDIIFMLSGGLDSSICCALGAEFAKKHNKKIKTMCIGMENGTDQLYAELVAKHLDTDHTMIKKSEDEFLDCCKHRVTAKIESYDITTNRASTPQLISAEEIASKTNCKVVIVGDYSDEVCGGYNETKLAPSIHHFRERIHELTEDIIYFDAQRVDRCVAGMGLEARTPFGDHRFIKLYMSIDPKLRVAKDGVEKYLLRKAFENFLPSRVVWRPKEAFSDGISSLKKSWYEIIQEEINGLYTEEDLELAKEKFCYLTPYTKESLHYRLKFNEFYSNKFATVLPSFWLPKWGGQKDPSARLLKNVYKQ
jgi:asparagine synthase (glutamine-hydrolysing)